MINLTYSKSYAYVWLYAYIGLLLKLYIQCQKKIVNSVPLYDYDSNNHLIWRCYPRTTLTQDGYFWREGGGYIGIGKRAEEMIQYSYGFNSKYYFMTIPFHGLRKRII